MSYVIKNTGWMSIIVMFCMMTACSVSVKRPAEPKTVSEQLLINKALENSLTDFKTEFPQGTPVALEVSGLTTDKGRKGYDVTQRHVKKVLAGRLGKEGLVIVEDSRKAKYQVRVIIETIGTNRGVRFVGMPAANSSFIPISIPELTLWRRDRRQGIARFYFDIFETGTGRFVSKTEVYTGTINETRYTLFFIFKWEESELNEPLERL
ncbi:hypothetical protein SAMN05421690_100386 [Nitrosomonas sp. Nm51]|uniref:hypothetical protein n=1 Tax=Nitrosomonas sp. Nm51 TaxID=133720 RepID=UPI0008B8495F|nr:hypothetical protein [Nitrosomonas sp. Nm51]SEQ90699.1 hypothetical protein SAMN05421690_100386 [Nitrosomonas sp. Nm51]